MANLTSKQLTELGEHFLAFAQAVGNYRMGKISTLSKSENAEIKDLHRALLDHSDNFFTTSARLVMNDIKDSLDTIKDVTARIHETYHTLKKVQNAINIAAAGVTLGAAIFAKKPEDIADAVKGVAKAWKERNA